MLNLFKLHLNSVSPIKKSRINFCLGTNILPVNEYFGYVNCEGTDSNSLSKYEMTNIFKATERLKSKINF